MAQGAAFFTRPERPARALIGWMSQDETHLALTARRQDVELTPEQAAQIARAHAVVAARPSGINQDDVETDVSGELDSYVAIARSEPSFSELLTAGWRVASVDLSRVIAVQPIVHVDHAAERTAGPAADDLVGLARVSLPVSASQHLPVQFDPSQRAWIVSSPNPNLRVVGHGVAASPVAGQPPVIGFVVSLLTSYVRVGRYDGRYILLDGYHRAYGFLRQKIAGVPALVGEVNAFAELALPGALPEDVFLGERPPLLRDYLDDSVSAPVRLPATQKTIVIPALELN